MVGATPPGRRLHTTRPRPSSTLASGTSPSWSGRIISSCFVWTVLYIVHAANLWSINQLPNGLADRWAGPEPGSLRICPSHVVFCYLRVCLHSADHQLPVDNRQQSSFGPPLDHSAFIPHKPLFYPGWLVRPRTPSKFRTRVSRRNSVKCPGRGCRYHGRTWVCLLDCVRIAAVSTDFLYSLHCYCMEGPFGTKHDPYCLLRFPHVSPRQTPRASCFAQAKPSPSSPRSHALDIELKKASGARLSPILRQPAGHH